MGRKFDIPDDLVLETENDKILFSVDGRIEKKSVNVTNIPNIDKIEIEEIE